MSADVDRFLEGIGEESDFRRLSAGATPPVREWCRRFLDGAVLSAQASLDERAGWLLAAQAPTRLRKRSHPHPAPFDDDDATGD